jgi:hypothetical protein
MRYIGAQHVCRNLISFVSVHINRRFSEGYFFNTNEDVYWLLVIIISNCSTVKIKIYL